MNRGKKCCEFLQSQKDKYIEMLTSKLAALRAHITSAYKYIPRRSHK